MLRATDHPCTLPAPKNLVESAARAVESGLEKIPDEELEKFACKAEEHKANEAKTCQDERGEIFLIYLSTVFTVAGVYASLLVGYRLQRAGSDLSIYVAIYPERTRKPIIYFIERKAYERKYSEKNDPIRNYESAREVHIFRSDDKA